MDQTPMPSNNENTPFYKTKDFWLEVARGVGVVLILAAVIVASVAVYKKLRNDADNSSEKDDSQNLITKNGGRLPKLSKNNGLHIVVTDIKNLCRDENLIIFDESGTVGFTALDDSAKMIVSSASAQGKSFEKLIEQLVTSTAPFDDAEMQMSDCCLIYDGYLDKSDHSLGYAYLELIYGDNDYYVMVQGLAPDPSDPSVASARDFSKRLEEYLKLK
ncbi:MAG: hypothetical protein IK109_11435 [Clostridiales bacterium]|nr:hypothetical protein [Clostridiales bacterium]MBR5418622.1 hypothetical protein [Clostridiales bacterium]